MSAFSDLSEGQAPIFERGFKEDQSILSALLLEKNNLVQNQISQINQLKLSVKNDLEIIKRLDEAVPAEEKKISELTEQYNHLRRLFEQLQTEMNKHSQKETINQSTLQNTEQELHDVLNEKSQMRSYIDQSSKKQKDLNDHIQILQNSCELLSNDIKTLKSDNTSHIECKNHIEKMQNELESETEKIEQIKKKQQEMSEYLTKTEILIKEYQNRNLKTELELYDQLKLKNSIKNQKEKLNAQIDMEPDIIRQNVEKAQQKLDQKKILLENEKELYHMNEEKMKKQQKKLYEQKKSIHRLKRQLKLFDTQIQQEQYLMQVVRQQHEQLMINTNQFSAQIEQSVKNIEQIRKEKKLMRKELQHAKELAEKLQNKISSIKSFDSMSQIEREPITKPEISSQDETSIDNPVSGFEEYQDNYHDNTTRTIEIMRRQSSNLKRNQNQFDNIRFDQQLLNKRIKNCHTGVLNRQYKRDSLFPTSRYSTK